MLLKFECCKHELSDARDENVLFCVLANIVSLKDKILS